MEGEFTIEIEGTGINVGRYFICRGDISVNIACVKKCDFIVDIDFLCEIENRIILKDLLSCVNLILNSSAS